MGSKSLPTDEMYKVLRGLPGEMELAGPSNEKYKLIVHNPNAPKNRCQETLGLKITLTGPIATEHIKEESILLSENQLEILRSGQPLELVLLNLEIVLNSNPGGHLIELD